MLLPQSIGQAMGRMCGDEADAYPATAGAAAAAAAAAATPYSARLPLPHMTPRPAYSGRAFQLSGRDDDDIEESFDHFDDGRDSQTQSYSATPRNSQTYSQSSQQPLFFDSQRDASQPRLATAAPRKKIFSLRELSNVPVLPALEPDSALLDEWADEYIRFDAYLLRYQEFFIPFCLFPSYAAMTNKRWHLAYVKLLARLARQCFSRSSMLHSAALILENALFGPRKALALAQSRIGKRLALAPAKSTWRCHDCGAVFLSLQSLSCGV
jgi:hypothetical protein